jgi:hypothetical protein
MGFRKWLGDYAGYAQEYFEQDHPGVTALFMMGCGGDQNPYPRSELKYAQIHGRTLATAIEAALEVNQKTPLHQRPLRGPLRSVLETVDLDFTEVDRPAFPYPVQVVQFGNDLMLVALASEVVVDYSLRLKLELTKGNGPAVWVAGYSNVYAGYIPSRRVLVEGGYEAASRPWDVSLEERIVSKVHELVGRPNPPPSAIPKKVSPLPVTAALGPRLFGHRDRATPLLMGSGCTAPSPASPKPTADRPSRSATAHSTARADRLSAPRPGCPRATDSIGPIMTTPHQKLRNISYPPSQRYSKYSGTVSSCRTLSTNALHMFGGL